MSTFSKILKDMHTGKDNETYDAAKVWLSISFLVFLCLSIYEAWVGKDYFHTAEFTGGVGALLVLFSIGQRLKKDTEPGN